MPKQVAVALLALLCAAPGFATAAESVRVAVPDRGAWDTSYTGFGIEQGFFARQGVDVRIIPVAHRTALADTLISGKADIAVAAGFVDVLTAWLKGAPIRIISPESTGAPDIFWFAKIAGPVAGMRDLQGQPVGYSKPGALTYFVLRTLLQEAGVDDANLVPVGRAEAGYPDVLGAQLAASWSKPPFNVSYLLAGEIRIIARGDDSEEVRNETVRVNAVNAHFLADHRDAVVSFLKAYQRSIDWAYSDPLALDAYASLSHQSLEAAKYIFTHFSSKEASQIDRIKGEHRMLAQALEAKRITSPLTHKDVSAAYDLVLKKTR
jgi:NitT/TauT family transport system substrate-binding protein